MPIRENGTTELLIMTRKEALARGLTRYFTGKACKRGHVCERQTKNATCVACQTLAASKRRDDHPEEYKLRRKLWREAHPERMKKYMSAWSLANPEKVKAYRTAWRLANKEKIKAKGAAYRIATKDRTKARRKTWYANNPSYNASYYIANRERIKARAAAWAAANPERARERSAAWSAANPERTCENGFRWRAANAERVKKNIAAYQAAHPDLSAAIRRNRRARLRGNGGSHTEADIAAIKRAQKGKCAHPWCRSPLVVGGKRNYHVDHVVPLSLGGTNDRKNLQLLCQKCNLRKSDKHPIKFAQEHGLLL